MISGSFPPKKCFTNCSYGCSLQCFTCLTFKVLLDHFRNPRSFFFPTKVFFVQMNQICDKDMICIHVEVLNWVLSDDGPHVRLLNGAQAGRLQTGNLHNGLSVYFAAVMLSLLWICVCLLGYSLQASSVSLKTLN